MSTIDKLIDNFKRLPNDFNWNDLTRLMRHFGFEESQKGKTSGSRVRFYKENFPPINLHKPHGKNSIDPNAMKDIKDYLEENVFI